MKEIRLGSGKRALVDDADYDRLSKWVWQEFPHRHTAYARRTVCGAEGKRHYIRMHREILGAPKGEQVDHADGNGLNNQRSNLRLATHADNMRNSKRREDNSSGYKGVYWQKSAKRWHAQITVHREVIYLGLFSDVKEGALAYDQAARQYFGEFARPNFPQGGAT